MDKRGATFLIVIGLVLVLPEFLGLLALVANLPGMVVTFFALVRSFAPLIVGLMLLIWGIRARMRTHA